MLLETNGGTQAEAIARTLREYVSADDARVFEEVAILSDYGGASIGSSRRAGAGRRNRTSARATTARDVPCAATRATSRDW